MEEVIKSFTLGLAILIEVAAAIVIGLTSVKALCLYFYGFFFKSNANSNSNIEIRIGLGKTLALALELELGADILKTAVAPTWNDLGMLAAIAVLRTFLNFFLEKEIMKEEKKRGL